MASTAFSGVLNASTSVETVKDPDDIPLESIPLYNIANYLVIVCSPIIVILGTFGNVMTIIIMQRMTSEESTINYYFTGIAVMDLCVLFFATFIKWLSDAFGFLLLNVNSVVCKIVLWLFTGSGTVSCWYLVCLTLHRALSVVWPHRVNLVCTRRTVLCLILGIAVFFAALYSHYLVGYDLVSTGGGDTFQCLMESEDYIAFVVDVFVYLELGIYSLFPFVCLVFTNAVLVWKLSSSIKDARSKFSQGNLEQVLARAKTANRVTLTVVVVSMTFVVLTLPVSIYYILFYFSREYRLVKGYEYAKVHLFQNIAIVLVDSNSAVNFYLYCLTGSRFRKEFFKIIGCGRSGQKREGSSAIRAISEQST